MQKRIGPQQDGAVGSFLTKKESGPKGGEKKGHLTTEEDG
jgi:hypothetical protein